jgi:hypothetical protein
MASIPQQRVQAVNLLSALTAAGPVDPNAAQSIPTASNALPQSTFLFVVDENTVYAFDPTSFAAPIAGSVILPGDTALGDPGRWVIVGSGGGPVALVGAPLPYVVQPPGSLPDLAAAGWQNVYPTITAAITQALADGHGQGDPTVISVLPGVYTEDISMQVGISVEGLGSSQFGAGDQVEIIGVVSLDAPGVVGSFLLENVTITGHITMNIAHGVSVLRKVFIVASGSPAIVFPTDAEHDMVIREGAVVSIDDIGISIGRVAQVTLDMQHVLVVGLQQSLVASAAPVRIRIEDGEMQGQFSVDGLTSPDGGPQLLRRTVFTAEDIPAVELSNSLFTVFERCTLVSEGDSTTVLYSDATQVLEALTVFPATAKGVLFINGAKLTSAPTLGLGKANTETVNGTAPAGAGETLIAQVPFLALFQADKIFMATFQVLRAVPAGTVTYRVAFADEFGFDIETLATYTDGDPSLNFMRTIHAPIAAPPLSSEDVMQSGSYNINLYASALAENVNFTGNATVYGVTPQ